MLTEIEINNVIESFIVIRGQKYTLLLYIT